MNEENNKNISKEQIEELTAFLHLFDAPERQFAKWNPGINDAGEVVHLPYPIYDGDVERFFGFAGQSHWMDYEYNPQTAGEMLDNSEFIKQANVKQIKTMLTYCVRGERFCDGHWESLLKEGKIDLILHRLKEISRATFS